jgi:peptidoglycan/xylan/chitin deacetylase (PgdA/CDA1 family)
MRGLLARGYRPWPLRRVLEYRRVGWPIPPRTFVVTFDDGYENTYHFAWPVLKAHRIPATIFLATAYLDGDAPMPCDDWPAAGSPHVPSVSWKPLSTRQCAEMLKQRLVELGTHTHTHADFRDRPDALREDLLISLDVLQERFGLTGATFAFPYGDQGLGFCSPRLTEVARELRLLCSLTTESEPVTPERDPFDWGRFPVEATDTAATLAAKLDGSYGRVRKVWRWLDRFPANGCARPAGELRRRHVRQSTESNMPRR